MRVEAIANGERPTMSGAKCPLMTSARLAKVSELPWRRQACVSPMPAMPALVCRRTSITSDRGPRRAARDLERHGERDAQRDGLDPGDRDALPGVDGCRARC